MDKAPGPDGFSGRFFQTAWSIIKDDVFRAIQHLYSLRAKGMRNLNDALIILLPKKDGAIDVKDFRPISLIHSFGKLFSKMLANRLAPRLSELVAENQSAFVKGRSIHDNLKMVQLTTRTLHLSRVPSMLIKVDITKAFDSVSWPFLLRVLRHLGFGDRFIEWICIILSTASSKLLLTSVPGRPILHRRGLRQGNPVSPMLFLLCMEVLNAALRRAEALGVLSSLPCQGVRFRSSMYADDVVIFVAPEARDLSFLRLLLESFGGATGPRTNLDKCSISPIRCSDVHLAAAALHFPCGIKPFPCSYLGLPLSYKRLPRASLQPIVDTICRRLAPGNAAF
jgi:mannosylglycoprotein endo-beta-mannosidase